MPFTYSKNIKGREQLYTDTAKRIAKMTGTHFSGDEKSGKFRGYTVLGEIGGSYVIANGVITITVTKKPFMVPESKLIAGFDRFFE